jgi:RNA polymerase sigma-70 factor (ECF subfamily)
MIFEEHRRDLFHLAYGMLGSIASAEDVVQEAWLRFERTDGVHNPGAFLRTVVSRLALDELKSARARRETYTGPWLPEPLPTGPDGPEYTAALAEALSMATLAVLEHLSPAERAAFLLREIFDLDYAEVAQVLERSEPATRQLVRRARQQLADRRRRFEPRDGAHASLLAAFAVATTTGDLASLKSLLADDVQLTSDGGGKVTAATRILEGPDRVGRFFIGTARKLGDTVRPELTTLNGQTAVVFFDGSLPVSAMLFSIADGRITAIHAVRNPEKIAHLMPTS